MTIDLGLVSLQALFLSLYGVNGVVQSIADKKTLWVAVFATYLGVAISCIFGGDYVKSNIQLLLFLLLVLNYFLHLLFSPSLRWAHTLIFSAITFMAYGLLYFLWESPVVWATTPLVFVAFWGLVNKWPSWFVNVQEYFLKAGSLLTLFFVVEPLLISVQQNLKPVATIPISSIINQQSFLLLSVLIMLMIGGFFWKEKSSL